jgi:excinuclease ABC subunit C
MKEVLGRRIKHFDDWGIPDLIIVDGGKPQVSVAQEVIKDIPLVGLAKQFETIVILKNGEFSEIRLQNGPAKNLMQRIRDEAHRFARRLHHKQVSKNLLGI